MTASSRVSVDFSQESLFFPFPFTNATIENVLQLTNRLPSSGGASGGGGGGDGRTNVVAFKVLSTVRHRYSVRPAIGFIAPGSHITVNFSLDPESIRINADPAARVLPTESTQDAIYVDIALVDAASASKYLASWTAAGGPTGARGAKDKKEVLDDASKFWKARGPVKSAAPDGSVHRKLACVFAAKDRMPTGLIVHTKADGSSAKNPAAAATASPPPQSPPHALPPTSGSTQPRSRPATTTAPATTTGLPQRQTLGSSSAAATGVAAGTGQRPSLQQLAMNFSDGEKLKQRKIMWKRVLNFKLPYVVVAAMVVLAMLCGFFESHTFLSWLIAGR